MAKRKVKELKSVREELVLESLHDEELTPTTFPALHRVFDEEGRLLLEETYGMDGQLAEKFTYRYENNLVAEKGTWMDENELAEKEVFFYKGDKLDYIIKSYNEGYEEKIILTYDAENRLLSRKPEDDEGESEEISYGDNTKTIVKHDEFGELSTTEKLYFDKKNQLIQKEVHDHIEDETTTHHYRYDSNGNIIQEEIKNHRGEKTIIETSYNDKQLPIQIITTSADGKTILDLSYDDSGNEIAQVEMDGENMSHKVSRKYDDDGNILETHVELFGNGQDISRIYTLKYAYEFF
jgi:hypothetical protein